MKRAFRHGGVLMMVGVLALGLMGAAYTLWYEDLSLTANVDTAQFDVDWSCQNMGASVPSNGGTSAGTNCDAAWREVVAIPGAVVTFANQDRVYSDFIEYGANTAVAPNAKYIQECSAAITTTNVGANDAGTNDQLTLTLTNLYPFAGCKFGIDIDMPAGADYVPAHFTVKSGAVTKDSAIGVVASTANGACAHIASILENEGSGVINSDFGSTNNTPFQLHAGENLLCTFIVYLKEFTDDTPTTVSENGTYTLQATITGHQWNEIVE